MNDPEEGGWYANVVLHPIWFIACKLSRVSVTSSG
jgi:hypothetical protein